ncbi:hypothetical protein B0O99DRAFT_591079 [Bisporella sp. PMI_857]|nr:hypothetical protein B0O99DRAFT_591079 [Bisporella sp. PMI_857]
MSRDWSEILRASLVKSASSATSASTLRTSPEQATVTVTSKSSSTHSSQPPLPETTEQEFISSTSSSTQSPENPRPSTSDQNSISSTPVSETFRTSSSDQVSSSASSTSPASAQQSETSLPANKNKDSSINPIALGIPLGLGIPLVIAALIFIFLKRRRSKPKAPYSDTISLSKRGNDLRHFPSSQLSPRSTSPGFYHLAKASPSELSAARPLVEAPANEVGPVELPTSRFDRYWFSRDGDAE